MAAMIHEHGRIAAEPNWLTGDLGKYPDVGYIDVTTSTPLGGHSIPLVEEPLQQSDLLKPLLMDIAKYGLAYAYKKYGEGLTPKESIDNAHVEQTSNRKHVIIVGAGMAGLVAAHELARVGHEVTILETQDRVGGRVKTIGGDAGIKRTHQQGGNFAKGLYADAGAMRLPCRPEARYPTHFLPDYYGNLFGLEKQQFVNSDDNAFLKFYNAEKIRIKDWKPSKTSEFWPGWDDRIQRTGGKAKYEIKDIGDYYDCTTEVIVDQLRIRLAGQKDRKVQAVIWQEWIDTWSAFSLSNFLTSAQDSIISQIPKDSITPELDKLGYLLPWPQAAITAYMQFTYTEQLDQSLVQYLRDQMGKWWSPHMHHFKDGMSELPNAFVTANNSQGAYHRWKIEKNFTVYKIEYDSSDDNIHKKVRVLGYSDQPGESGRPRLYTAAGHAVIVTTPVHILRQIDFQNVENTPQLPHVFYNAISDIWYGPSTKIMLQCKTRFWESEKYDIRGGSSRTTLPIGQLYYPSNPKDDPAFPEDVKGGILLVYTWKSEALMFGSLNSETAVEEAVRQITEIHPEMKDEYDNVWAIEPWYNEPSAQGAYCLLKPTQYRNVNWLMYPWQNLYFAGEAISFASGWIQGALESGLRAAYQFYARNEEEASGKKKPDSN